MEWYVIEDNRKLGPYSTEQLREKLRRGEITLESLVTKAGSPVRRRIMDVAEIIDANAPSIPKPEFSVDTAKRSQTNTALIKEEPTRAKDVTRAKEEHNTRAREEFNSRGRDEQNTRAKENQNSQVRADVVRLKEPPPPVKEDATRITKGPAVARAQSPDSIVKVKPIKVKLRHEKRDFVEQPQEMASGLGAQGSAVQKGSMQFESVTQPLINPANPPAEKKREYVQIVKAQPPPKPAPKVQSPKPAISPAQLVADDEPSIKVIKPASVKRQVKAPSHQLPQIASEGQIPNKHADINWAKNRVNPTSAKADNVFSRHFMTSMKTARHRAVQISYGRGPIIIGVTLIIGAIIALVSLFTVDNNDTREKPSSTAERNVDEVKSPKKMVATLPPPTAAPTEDPEPARAKVRERKKEKERPEPTPEPRRTVVAVKRDPPKPPPVATRPPPKPAEAAPPPPPPPAAPSGPPAGWPGSWVRTGPELQQKQFNIASIDGLFIQSLPPICSPCRIMGRLVDGTKVALVSPTFAPWAGIRKGGSVEVAVKGLVRKEADGEFGVVVQSVMQR